MVRLLCGFIDLLGFGDLPEVLGPAALNSVVVTRLGDAPLDRLGEPPALSENRE